MAKPVNDYTIKEGYTLPSEGRIYTKRVNPHVELRSMTTRDEMKRTNPSNTPYKVLADIIEGCMLEKPAVHVYDMCLGDYEYLLHKLRVVTYGPSYKMAVVCPKCGEVTEIQADLDALTTQEFDVEAFQALQTLELPTSNHIVTLKFQTPRTLDEIELRSKEMSRKFKNSGLNYTNLVTVILAIDTVDGVKMPATELEDFVFNLPARDSNLILNRMVKINKMIGLDTEIEATCSSCGGDILTFFRFGPEFFRPSED